jgi:very-short-patch-repair endonuclease
MTKSRATDQAVAKAAAGQRTLLRRPQLLAIGLSARAIQYRLDSGVLRLIHEPGVYALGQGPLPPLAEELAAIYACGEGSVLSHHASALLWGLRPSRPPYVDVTVIGRNRRSRLGVRVHRVQHLDPRETRPYGDLPATSPARALLEIAPDLSPRALERALDEGIAREMTSVEEVLAVLARNAGRPGSAPLHALVSTDRPTTLTDSAAAERFLTVIRRAQIPEPEVNVWLGRHRVDFLWRAEKLVVEVDGYRFHSSRGKFERDRAKDAELTAAGFIVIRVTWRQLERDSEAMLARVAMTLARRACA